MITYKETTRIDVYLDKRLVGTIYEEDNGFAYHPKGSKTRGPTFNTIAQVKRSLESE